MKKIIDYLENPRVIEEYSFYGMNRVDFEQDKLKEMIIKLNKKAKLNLLNKVVRVCEMWNSLRVAPKNDIGTIARYQIARQILEADL
jgi:hypothetical protein